VVGEVVDDVDAIAVAVDAIGLLPEAEIGLEGRDDGRADGAGRLFPELETGRT
jgi:hypothetical protein